MVGGTSIPGLARWNGNAWVRVGTGIADYPYPDIRALHVYNNLLFVGGDFTFNDGDLQVQSFCDEWNGTSWTHGADPPGPIDAFGVANGSLFCGTDSDSTHRGVYQYTGSQWIPLGLDDVTDPCCNTQADVLAIANYQSHAVAGGEFERFVGSNSATWHVASWDGTSWGPLATGLNGPIDVLIPYGTSLVAGGSFDNVSGGWDVAGWDGASWSPFGLGLHLASGFPGAVTSLVPLAGSLVATGNFDITGTLPIHGIARWDGAKWDPWVAGINGPVRAFLPSGTSMVLGGNFDFSLPNNAIASHVMAVDSSGTLNSYTDLSNTSGPNGQVNAVAFFQERKFPPLTALVVGGVFSGVGPTAAPNIAQFVNGTWGAIGSGFNAAVNALAPYGAALYAAGEFTASGGTPVPHLAKFSSGAWSDIGVGTFPPLSSLAVVNGLLLIGGVPGGSGSDGVSAWNGSSLTTYATANGKVLALAAFGRDIVAAGSFTSIGGVAAAGVARRDSVTGLWSPMGAGFSGGAVNALVVHNGNLYAGGAFTASGGTTVQRFAIWDGATWVDVASGVDDVVLAMASWNGNLHLGGGFNLATDPVTISPYWILQPSTCYVGVSHEPVAQGLMLASRTNPMIRRAALQYSIPASGHARLTIDDVAGRVIRTLVNGWTEAGPHAVNWDGRSEASRASPPGVYFARLECDGLTRTCRLVLLP